MNAKTLESQLIVMGESRALIEDYLDSTNTPSIDGYWEYKRDEELSYNAQVRWDSLSQNQSIFTSGAAVDGSSFAGLMSNIEVDGSTIVGLMANINKSKSHGREMLDFSEDA